jgi:hypothetical protein
MTIVYAIAVLGVLAIVFGLILAVAAKVFEVEVDPRLPEIQACLAGANCGGCGYPGCGGCAEAILARYRLRPRRPRERGEDRRHHGHGGSLRRQDGGARAVQRRLQRQG